MIAGLCSIIVFLSLLNIPAEMENLYTDEMKRCVHDLGFRGFEIGSHINSWNLDDAHLEPIWKTAEELDTCIFVHPWDMHRWDGRLDKYWMPWLVGMPAETTAAICSVLMGGVLERHPRLRLCFAHGGGAYPFLQGRIAHGFACRPDLCATDCGSPPAHFHGRFYTDSLVHDERALELLVDTVGQDKVVLGTDYPFPLGDLEAGEFLRSGKFSKEKQNKIFLENAKVMLQI